jgi:hypothetical protein
MENEKNLNGMYLFLILSFAKIHLIGLPVLTEQFLALRTIVAGEDHFLHIGPAGIFEQEITAVI